jgi:FKBP-type peptidyl-prolyl cis-trans isomerase
MNIPALAALALAAASLQAADDGKVVPATASPAAPATSPAAPTPPPAPVKDLTPEQQKQAFFLQGFFLVRQAQWASIATELDLSDEEVTALLNGMRAALKNETPSFKAEEIIPGAEKMIGERVAGKAKRWAAQNEAYLAKVDADKEFTKTASGLRFKVLVPGADPKPTATSTVKCLYTGKTVDGKVFDSTSGRGNQPAEFPLNGVIPAWTEAVPKIGVGGKILLVAPANIAYGENGQGPIPPNSVLEFEVELVEIVKGK